MSLILEALKKSEEQRRLGEMPNLGTPITATRRRRSLMPWLATTAIVVIAAVGGWRFLRHPPAAVPDAGQATPAKAAAKSEVAGAPVATRQPVKPPAPPITQTVTAMPAPAPTPAAPLPKREAPPPAALPPPPAMPTAPVRTAAPAPAPAPVSPAPSVPAPAAPPAAPAPAPAASDVPTIDELPPEVRSALPVLPITMQVYSPDPKRRFVIIDGTRVVEGESLRGVTVQEIRPAGLVLEFQGRRVLMPRPGS